LGQVQLKAQQNWWSQPGPPLKRRSVIEELNVHRTVHTSFPGRVAHLHRWAKTLRV